MSDRRKCQRAAQRIFREWCEANGLAVDPLAAADLCNRIAALLGSNRAPTEQEGK